MNELISGVEILSSTEVVVETIFSWSSCVTVFFVAFVASLVIGFLIGVGTDYISDSLLAGLVVGTFFGLLFGIWAGVIFNEPAAYETQYKVTIDNSVSMNEFLDNYEIINTEGKIYTIRAKTESALAS